MYRNAAQFYTQANKDRFEELTASQRELVVAFVSPNGEALTNEGLTMFFSLIDDHTIAFAQSGTPNEHLHVPHTRGQAKYWCTTCAAMELVAA